MLTPGSWNTKETYCVAFVLDNRCAMSNVIFGVHGMRISRYVVLRKFIVLVSIQYLSTHRHFQSVLTMLEQARL